MPLFFFFNDTATTEIYTLSLHDALPICRAARASAGICRSLRVQPSSRRGEAPGHHAAAADFRRDRKSTRLNSSHSQISYAVFCLKKKKRGFDRVAPHRDERRQHIDTDGT